MRFINTIKGAVYKMDLLSSGSLLRVKGEPEHNTLLGGFISITLIIVLAAVFWNKIIDTFDKIVINTSTATSNADDPPPISLTSLDAGPFMFGVEVWHHNLNEGNRYFDVVLTNTAYIYGEPQSSSVQYALQPCTREHWKNYPQIQSNFEQLNIQYWKCIPKNTIFELKGKYSSASSKTLDVAVKKCTNGSDVRPCAPQAEIDQFFADNGVQFFTIYFLNPLINPDSQEYLYYYLQDSNYIAFSQNGGEESRLLVEDYQIVTDQSILPISNTLVQSGGVVTTSGLKSTYTSITDTYAIFFFFKSSVSTVYNRSFQRIDDVFSYIGGLFGIILIVFFLVSNYNTYKFEINIAGYLFRSRENADKAEKKYNLFYFLGQALYTVLKSLNFHPKWDKLNFYSETREQMLKQLDILYLLKRVNFLEKSLTFLFTDNQLKGLHLANQLTLSEATNMRRNYKLKARLKGEIISLKKRTKNQRQQQHSYNFNDCSISNDVIFKTQVREQKSQDDPISHNLDMTHSFDSDHYSSDESSDEGESNILESIRQLHFQQSQNQLSQKIMDNIDTRLQNIVNPVIFKSTELKTSQEIKNDYTGQLFANKNQDQAQNDFMELESEGKIKSINEKASIN